MKKIIIALLIILFPLQVLATTTTSNGITDPLEHYTWYDTFKSGVKKAFSLTKPINEKLLSWFNRHIRPTITEWGMTIINNIKQGIKEEKEELGEKTKEDISNAIKKVWNFFKKEETETLGD